jgi:hypothetical protein
MALVLADRVKETTTTTGTGTLTLLGASIGFQSFAAVGDGNTTYYTISSNGGAEFEVGIGTYTSSGTTLSRTTVLTSSNSGSLVNLSAGTKDVFVTYPASKSTYETAGQEIYAGADGSIYLNAITITKDTAVPANYNGMSAGPITVASGITVTVATGSVWTVV